MTDEDREFDVAEPAPATPPAAGVPDADDIQTGAWPPDAQPARGRRILSVAVVVLLAASSATFGTMLYLDRRSERAENAIEAVSRRFVEHLITFDHRTFDADIAKTRTDVTGSFRRQLDRAFGGSVTVFRDAIVKAQAQSQGQVRSVSVGEVEGDAATAIVVADQTIRNATNAEGQTVIRLIQLSLVNTADGWRVDDVETLGGG